MNRKIARLYNGPAPPALHRFGETDDREHEVMRALESDIRKMTSASGLKAR